MAEAKVQAERLFRYGVIYILGTLALVTIVAGRNLPSPGPLGLVPVWAILCGVAAYRRELVAWSILCLVPLLLISADWLALQGVEDPLNLRWWDIQLFTAASLVTAATGILMLVPQAASRHLVWIKG